VEKEKDTSGDYLELMQRSLARAQKNFFSSGGEELPASGAKEGSATKAETNARVSDPQKKKKEKAAAFITGEGKRRGRDNLQARMRGSGEKKKARSVTSKEERAWHRGRKLDLKKRRGIQYHSPRSVVKQRVVDSYCARMP